VGAFNSAGRCPESINHSSFFGFKGIYFEIFKVDFYIAAVLKLKAIRLTRNSKTELTDIAQVSALSCILKYFNHKNHSSKKQKIIE
jgi:hypothetical protein